MARLSGSEGSELLAHYVESEMDPGVRVRRFVVTQTRLSPGGTPCFYLGPSHRAVRRDLGHGRSPKMTVSEPSSSAVVSQAHSRAQ